MAVIKYRDDTVEVEQIPGERDKSPALAPAIWEAKFTKTSTPFPGYLRGHGSSEQMAIERLYDLRDQRSLLKTLSQSA